MHVEFQVFRSTLATWQTLFTEAADFASTLDPRQLITISHSADHSNGVVTVWYWSSPPRPPGGTPASAAAEETEP